jgi:hypothetical protein
MSSNSKNSPPTTTESMQNFKLIQLKKDLDEKGVDVDSLHMFFLPGGDVMMGEVMTPEVKSNTFPISLAVKSPKRIIRSQFRGENGQLGISFGMGDYDLLAPGSIMHIVPNSWVRLSEQPPEVQEQYIGLYLEHLKQRMLASAMQAGIALPGSPLIKR